MQALSDSNRNILTNNGYLAFGRSFSDTSNGPEIIQRLGYTGRELSPINTPQVYYRNRHYFMGIDRFLTRDISGYPNNIQGNLYDYVYSNPVAYIDPMGLGIKWDYITPDEVEQYYTQHAKNQKRQTSILTLGQIRRRRGFKVWYEGGCTCKNGKAGAVALVQYILRNGLLFDTWEVDSLAKKPWTQTCPNGTTVTRQPAYLDPNPDDPAGRSNTPADKPGSYCDSPTQENKFKVEAWCRCPCEDDRLLEAETIEINYTKQ